MFLPRKGPMLAVSAAVITMTGIAGADDLPQEIINCRALLTADERLSCYDRVIDGDTASASNNVSSSQSESQPKASETETASQAEPPTAEYERVIDEDTASASNNVNSSQSEPQPKASQAETTSRVESLPTAETAPGEKQKETIATAEDSHSPEALFGMSAEEQLVVVRMEEPGEQIKEIETGISKLRYSRTGKAVITLDSAQIWQQMDSQKLHLSENDRVVIRRASLGSFFLKKAGSKKSMRVQRIR